MKNILYNSTKYTIWSDDSMPCNNFSVLWAKKPAASSETGWLPLIVHMNDTAETARFLWDDWLPAGMRRRIVRGITANGEMTDEETARAFFIFIAGAHDVGKASPIFQIKRSRFSFGSEINEVDEMLRRSLVGAGFPLAESYGGAKHTHHPLLSHAIFCRNGLDESAAVIVGGHHGKPPSKEQLRKVRIAYKADSGFSSDIWRNAQDSLLEHARVYAGLGKEILPELVVSRSAQVLLSGLLIFSDWLASSTIHFPLMELEEYEANSAARAKFAFDLLKLPTRWKPEQDWADLFWRRFDIEETRPVQDALLKATQNAYKPGIFVVEAPMGEGKTEAALAAAEVLANKAGCRGVYFALPSQATSNAMFSRLLEWIRKFDSSFDSSKEEYNVRLMHGKAEMNEPDFIAKMEKAHTGDDDEEDNSVAVHEWMSGRKKAMLSDFVAGTIDHVLMAGLKQKHLAMRHLGLASKVVVIDECHAYDTYMNSYLLTALRWLGAHGVPVVVLSATLPASRRDAVINAYMNKKTAKTQTAYPLITYTDGGEVRQVVVEGNKRTKDININKLREEDLLEKISIAVENGGCIGVIANTVTRAQKFYRMLAERFGTDEVKLLHARFMATDRASKEKELSDWLGPEGKASRPPRLIVVGTQVFEQSLDIDFDMLITELCPMDLLIQRIGRLQRHKRGNRAEGFDTAECYVLNAEGEFESGACAIYGEYLLDKTLKHLPETISLPDGIPSLVGAVYDDNDEMTPLKTKHKDAQEKAEDRAGDFQIKAPSESKTLINWLENIADDSGKHGEAAVRDGDESFEVIVLDEKDMKISLSTFDDNWAKETAKHTVRLPSVFGRRGLVKQTITELEENMIKQGLAAPWARSKWLKGELGLLLNESNEAKLCGFTLRYSSTLGLICEKESKETEGYD